MDLNEFLEPNRSVDRYYEEVLRFFEYRCRLYALPVFFSPLVMFYNRDLLADSGLQKVGNGWTWDDFVETAEKLTIREDDDFIQRYGFIFSQYRNRWLVYLLQNGGQVIAQPQERCTVNSQEVKEAIHWLTDLIYMHKVSPVYPGLSEGMARKLFREGRAAMIIDSFYSLNMFKENTFDLGIANLPKGKIQTTGLVADAFGISKNTSNLDAAWQFISFVQSDSVQKELKSTGGTVPIVKEIAESADILPGKVKNDDYMVFKQCLPYARRMVDISDPRCLQPFFEKIDLVWSNIERIKTVCEQSEIEVNQLISEGLF